ncbi:touch insensitive larva B [Andrena cerasifolii]|uniref:touch insensitive larva B n=1 Tax=Andrena cerasifolii TaxID=2819439 RepID=UPI0040378E65
MSRITLDLIRKRSEHNEGEIGTLEEIALHQENIKKIETIDGTCKHLKILLLQHNLISKIENLSKLKRLEYLNLALNNIEVIENLEGLESLKKLDLTVNFIGDLRGIGRLRCNTNLEQLFLIGNPCVDYHGYREYSIATLTQLKELDGVPIDRSERIKALQARARIEGDIVRSWAQYKRTREVEILGYRERRASEATQEEALANEEEDEAFWKRVSRHTPEERIDIAERFLRKEELRSRKSNEGNEPIRREPKLFTLEGRPYNVNQAKVPFRLNQDEYEDRVVLEVTVYKYLDTQYVDVDVQPEYVRITIKGKVLQLVLPCEVSIEDSVAKRNTTNGKLVVTMPRLNPLPAIRKKAARSQVMHNKKERDCTAERKLSANIRRQYLEIGPATEDLDFSRIVDRSEPPPRRIRERTACEDNDWSDSEVPPLE